MDPVTPRKGLPLPAMGDDHTDVTSVPGPWDSVDPDADGESRTTAPTSAQISQALPAADGDDYDLSPGTAVGEYRIERKLGQGGMGVVFLAVHPLIGKRAAIKILKKELCADPHTLERFIDEARVVNQIGHPNIVDVFAFGTIDGRSYFVMEWLKGETLRARIARGDVTLAEVGWIVRSLARALQAAHDKGVIHRDLKPDNVFLVEVRDDQPTVKLLDFGIAKLAHTDHRVERTATGAIVGTPQYIAPEQAKGYAIDTRADIYALGGILFELLTGRPPFVADNAMEMVAKHLMETPPAPSSLRPSVPPELDALVLRMLAKAPDGRPTLAEVVAGVKERAASQPVLRDSQPALRDSQPAINDVVRSPTAGDQAAPVFVPATERSSPALLPMEGASAGSHGSVLPVAPISQPSAVPQLRRPIKPLWLGMIGVPIAGLLAFMLVSSLGKTPEPAASEPPTPVVAQEPALTPPPPETTPPPPAVMVESPPEVAPPPPKVERPPSQVDPRPRPGRGRLRLVLTNRTPRTEILVDNAPYTAGTLLAAGPHQLEIRSPRLDQPIRTQIEILKGQTTTKTFALPPPKKDPPPPVAKVVKKDPPPVVKKDPPPVVKKDPPPVVKKDLKLPTDDDGLILPKK